jgi:hypothetical protein
MDPILLCLKHYGLNRIAAVCVCPVAKHLLNWVSNGNEWVLLTGFRTGTTPPLPGGLEIRVHGLELSLQIRSFFFPRFS